MTKSNQSKNQWYIYIVECSDSSFYTGITTNIERRIYEHNHTARGSKYTRQRRPVKLIHSEESPDRSSASKREAQIKKLSRQEKQKIIQKQ